MTLCARLDYYREDNQNWHCIQVYFRFSVSAVEEEEEDDNEQWTVC